MPSQVVTYKLDDATLVRFEIEPAAGFRAASAEQIMGHVRDAVTPALEAAKVVLDRIKQARPHEVELRFGIKASGTANWLVAKAASEGNFEIILTWRSGAASETNQGSGSE